MYFQNIRRISVAVTSSNTKSKLKKAPFPTEKAQDDCHISRKRAERSSKCCSNTT